MLCSILLQSVALPIQSRILPKNLKLIGSTMKRLSLFALLAVMLSACTQDTTSDLLPLDVETIYASIDVEESRIQLNGQQKTVWNANDQIVVHAPTEASLWTFTGKTGDRDGSFKRAGTFRFDNFSKYGFKKYYALYPYDNWEKVFDGHSTV